VSEDSVQERVAFAVDALAVNTTSIQDRLVAAGVTLAPLLLDDFREAENRQRYVEIMDALTAVEPSGSSEGSLTATAARLSDEEAVEIARKITALDRACRPFG
jgi:hypothetical protein